jgi:hypothetical protein
LATDSLSDLVVGGRFVGTLGLAGSTLNSGSGGPVQNDGFLMKITP